MAYTPNAATQAALAKSRSGQKLSATEQALLTAHSKQMIADMSPTVHNGGGQYDYNSGISGGYGYGMNESGPEYLTSAGISERYNNFIQEEQRRRAQGMAPRQMPLQFMQVAQYNNPLGYDLNPTQSYMPTVGSQGYKDLQAAGYIGSTPNQVSIMPVKPSSPYSQPTQPTPQTNPGVTPTPTNVTANPTATLPFNPSDALPSAPQTVRTPNGGLELGNSVAGIDEGKLLAEAELQKQLRQQTYTQQVAGRKAMLDELSGVLQKQQAAMLGDQMPGIYEDLNTRGLLRSSALGEKVGLEATKLARQTSEQLALQGLTDRGKAIDDISAIEEAYLGGRGSAVQRRFSLEDFDRQVAAGEKLGANALPQISQPSGKGAGALQGALGGGGIGAQVGGPQGAVIGGIVGGLGGGQLASK